MQTQQISVAFSGDIPGYYDAYLGPMFFEPFALDMANRISKYSFKNILELASGTGRLTKLLPIVAPGATIIASDINPAMVDFGKEKVNHQSIRWHEIDAVTLPFSDKTFDCVAVQFGVMFYSDRMQAFREAWRVLKPGGIFIFTCWDEIIHNPMALIANGALKKYFPVDTPGFYSVPFSYFDQKIINSDLSKAGFPSIKIETAKLKGSCKTSINAAKGLILGTPTISAIKERDEEKLPLIMDYIEEEVTKAFGAETIKVPLQAHVVVAVKK